MALLLEARVGSDQADYYRVGARAHLERRGVKVVNGRLEVGDRAPGPVVPFPLTK